MEQLLVRLGAQYDAPINWLVWSSTEEEIIASGELPDASALSTLAERAGQRPIIALAPSSEILLKWVALPPRAGRKVISALPFMLEDELASDINEQFFAIGPKEGDQQAVAVVSKEKLSAWQSWLSDAGLFCDRLIPDVLAVPLNDNGWSVMTLGDNLLVRQQSFGGMQGESAWLLPMLSHFASQEEETVQIANFSDSDLSDIPNAEVSAAPLELPMHLLAKEAMATKFNLFQGDYKVKRQRSNLWAQWRVAAVLAVLALSSSLIDKTVTLYQLKSENAALSAEIDKTVKAGFPRIGVYRNVRLKVQSELDKLQQGGSQASMLLMLDQISGAFEATNVKPQTLRFDASRTEIRLQAVGRSFDALEQFSNRVRDVGFEVEQGAFNNRDDVVVGTVSIRSAS